MAEADKQAKTGESVSMSWSGKKPITREAGNPEGEARIRIPGSRTARDAGVRHGLAEKRRATRVTWPCVSKRALFAISFSRSDLKSCFPSRYPAVQICERK